MDTIVLMRTTNSNHLPIVAYWNKKKTKPLSLHPVHALGQICLMPFASNALLSLSLSLTLSYQIKTELLAKFDYLL